MSNEQTFDLDNQPGIRKTPIRRSQFTRLAEALGLDPTRVLSIEAAKDRVVVTTLLQTTDGNLALGGGHEGGYLKHTYTIPVVDDEEDMPPSEYYGRSDTSKAVKDRVVAIGALAKIRAIAPGQEHMYFEMAAMLASVGATEDQATDFAKQIAKGDA